jgi:hypothetical protein
VRLEGLGQLKKSNDIRNRTRDLRACSIVPTLKQNKAFSPSLPLSMALQSFCWTVAAFSVS